MYYVYILKSKKDESRYIGATKDLNRRLQEHNSGSVRFTRSKRPFAIAWYCVFKDKIKAYNFERYLKSSSGYAFTNKRLM